MTADTPREPPSAPAREPEPDERELYRRFLEKRADNERRKEAENRDKVARVTYELEHRVARALGAAADNGKGSCRWCGIALGHARDDAGVEYRTHPPVRECPGPPPPPCELCARALWFDKATRQWTHECTAGTRQAPVKSTHIARPGGSGYFGYRRGE